MPLTPLPESNTARLIVNYVHDTVSHEVQFRLLSPFTQADLVSYVRGWITAHATLWGTTTVFESADWMAMGEDVRNPVSWDPISGTGVAPTDETRFSRSFSFVGRSPDGRKVRLFFYGGAFAPDAQYRVGAGEVTALGNAITSLNSLQSRVGTISGSAPVFKPYVNIRNNAYWQTELRT